MLIFITFSVILSFIISKRSGNIHCKTINNRITICYNKVYTAVQGVLQNVAYLEKQQHVVLDDTATASYRAVRSKHIFAYIRL